MAKIAERIKIATYATDYQKRAYAIAAHGVDVTFSLVRGIASVISKAFTIPPVIQRASYTLQ
jgi:hypothetical protein